MHSRTNTRLLLGNYGYTLIALGDFDRALTLRTQALELYTKIGEEDERAVELAALGGLYFRMGDPERALRNAARRLIEQERISATAALASTLRVTANVASVLGDHQAALEYLRKSAAIDANPHAVARTRVLIATELREVGDLAAAETELTLRHEVRRTRWCAPPRSRSGPTCGLPSKISVGARRSARGRPAIRRARPGIQPHRHQHRLVPGTAGPA